MSREFKVTLGYFCGIIAFIAIVFTLLAFISEVALGAFVILLIWFLASVFAKSYIKDNPGKQL